ncbi:protein melted [Galendromus occidentalis]|uniref:Protein melted n=1 Tax=Galendromus occidentalis TaxID=34638 RepID=A0AAJ6VYF7_9ACAR|nr:protein melted [Galendromus occidentalis]
MHELFLTVLSRQELSRAGELFSLEDEEVLPCASEVLLKIRDSVIRPTYAADDNAQSVVEICLARVIAAIRDSGEMEKFSAQLVALLEGCLQHDLKPSRKDEHPPHAKVAADVMSCIFLKHNSPGLMKRSLGVTVRFLHRGNRDLSLSVTRYLCLAATHHADLLVPHIQPIVESIINGNYALCKVLPSIYQLRQYEYAINDHLSALLSILPLCDHNDRLSLLGLFELMAKSDASLLDGNLAQLTQYLSDESTAPTVLRIFVEVSNSEPQLVVDILPKVQQAAQNNRKLLALFARLYANVANTNRDMARISLDMLALQLTDTALASQQVCILKEIKAVLDNTNISLSSLALEKINQVHCDPTSPSMLQFYLQQIRRQQGSLRDLHHHHTLPSNVMLSSASGASTAGGSQIFSSRPFLGSSHTLLNGSLPHVHGGSRNGSQQIHRSLGALGSRAVLYLAKNRAPPSAKSMSIPVLMEEPIQNSPQGSDEMTASSSTRKKTLSREKLRHASKNSSTGSANVTSTTTSSSSSSTKDTKDSKEHEQVGSSLMPFEPMRDTVQHFCEKHLDKIKAYMETVLVKLPLPLKCTIEERGNKKYAKLHFGCQGKGENCLYNKTLFVSKTKNAHLWIHVMFLAIQARAPAALSTREPSLSALKNCWDSLKQDNRSFLTLVTSAFPSAKDMENLMSELRGRRFLDVFEYNGTRQMWACFLCNHPDRAHGFLQESLPVIQGQLKEKRKRWKLFRQWRTKYFTLSGANLSCRELTSDSKDTPIGEVQSVRAIQGRNRHIPKAFEIFTADDKAFVLKAKSSKHTEEWVQCLSIALARTHATQPNAAGAKQGLHSSTSKSITQITQRL